MGHMDAILIVHPTQLMAVIQKKIKLTVNSIAQKKDCKFWKDGFNTCHIFGGWNVGQ